MKNIKTIEEIRINIDKIDLEILNLIEKRKKLVDRVVKLKTKPMYCTMVPYHTIVIYNQNAFNIIIERRTHLSASGRPGLQKVEVTFSLFRLFPSIPVRF